MQLTHFGFLIFLLIGVPVYYLVPKHFQRYILLIMSYIWYVSMGPENIIYLLITTISVYIAGRLLGSCDKKDKARKKLILTMALILNFGILAIVKYSSFVLGWFPSLHISFSLLLPIGISFYTFQSMSYLIDVYQGKYSCETNIFNLALFIAFFPQILQGPMGRYDRLNPQYLEPHTYEERNIQYAIQRILWGYFKKIVIANRIAVAVNLVFDAPDNYYGLSVILGVLSYCIQLYCDFSGGIDVVIGVSELFGIKLDENFKRPFFSHSISEFWRRWHITLGTWMKDYIFYPYTLSKHVHRFSKRLKSGTIHICSMFARKEAIETAGKTSGLAAGRYLAKVVPICLADLLIFFIVGVWHGAAWKFIAYGMYNGIIVAVSGALEPLYKKILSALHICRNAGWFKIFQIIRTFILVNIGWYFDRANNMHEAWTLFRHTFVINSANGAAGAANLAAGADATGTDLIAGVGASAHAVNFFTGLIDSSGNLLGLPMFDWCIIIIAVIILFIVSLLQERGLKIRDSIAALPLPIRWAIYLLLIFSIPLLYPVNSASGGFMYANF